MLWIELPGTHSPLNLSLLKFVIHTSSNFAFLLKIKMKRVKPSNRRSPSQSNQSSFDRSDLTRKPIPGPIGPVESLIRALPIDRLRAPFFMRLIPLVEPRAEIKPPDGHGQCEFHFQQSQLLPYAIPRSEFKGSPCAFDRIQRFVLETEPAFENKIVSIRSISRIAMNRLNPNPNLATFDGILLTVLSQRYPGLSVTWAGIGWIQSERLLDDREGIWKLIE